MVNSRLFSDKRISELLRTFLNATLKELMKKLSAQRGSLFLFDSETEELVLDSFYNPHLNVAMRGLRKKRGQDICGKVITEKIPVLVKDINSDFRFKTNGYSHYSTGSFISIPLYLNSNPVGLINICDKSTSELFSERDLAFANCLCRYALVIIEQQMEFSRIRQLNQTNNLNRSVLQKYASVGKMASEIVHSINNPLDGVMRFANMLHMQLQDQPHARDYLSDIKKGLLRIHNITNSLLKFGSQVSFAKSYHVHDVDLNNVLDDSIEVFSARINKDVTINKDYAKGLPRIKDLGLGHVFTNIIKNALDAMPDGGVLSISTHAGRAGIQAVIKDTGKGISFAIREHLFEPFFTTKKAVDGAGLGLSICKEIVQRYEGKIEIDSFPGKGSAFIITLPYKTLTMKSSFTGETA